MTTVIVSFIIGAVIGSVTGAIVTNRWWVEGVASAQINDKINKTFGMADICRNCGCQEWDRQ